MVFGSLQNTISSPYPTPTYNNMKSNFMKNLTSFQLPQTVKIALVVLAIYGLIALITYLVW
jgi:hypothetical protein